MGTTTFTVKLINSPGSTGRGSIVGTNDERLGVFPEKVGLFEVGKTYEIEYVETDRNGKTLRNVKSAKQVAGISPQAQQPAPSSNSHGNGNGHYRQTDPVDAERMFVTKLLGDAITSGAVKFEKQELWSATQLLRGLWKHTFGFDAQVFTPSEVGRKHLVAAE
jgi:hypothetical protein